MARHFGRQSQRDVDKWAEVEHVRLVDGRTPALADCCARFYCTIHDRRRTGDHDCIVGLVVHSEVVSGGAPLPMRAEDYL